MFNTCLVSTDDYRTHSVTLYFDICATRVCEDLSLVNDNISETIESFHLTLERTSDLDSRIILNPSNAEVTIIDDDGK